MYYYGVIVVTECRLLIKYYRVKRVKKCSHDHHSTKVNDWSFVTESLLTEGIPSHFRLVFTRLRTRSRRWSLGLKEDPGKKTKGVRVKQPGISGFRRDVFGLVLGRVVFSLRNNEVGRK